MLTFTVMLEMVFLHSTTSAVTVKSAIRRLKELKDQ
jgi:hypothetical protein